MHTFTTLFLLAFLTIPSHAQNIFSALHFKEVREFRYGKPYRIVETNTFYSPNGTHVDKTIKTFDDTGMPLTEERYDETGNLKAKLTNLNDTTRHLCLQNIFERWESFGYSKKTSIYTYDINNFLIRIANIDANGDTTMISELVNNDKGNPVELRLYDGSMHPFGVEKADYFYDKNIAITTVLSNDGRKISADTLKIDFRKRDAATPNNYNAQGDAISYTSKNLDGSKTLYEEEYIYDKTGNCIDEKIYKVKLKNNGKKKKSLDRHFEKQINYR